MPEYFYYNNQIYNYVSYHDNAGPTGMTKEIKSSNPTRPEVDSKFAASGLRSCVLVLGMHRSGTSALTRLLSLVGADLPKRILGAGVGNETGHWEPEALINFHDQLLAEMNRSWYDWREIDLRTLPSSRLEAARNDLLSIVEEDYSGSGLFVVKDPRACRFASFFISTLKKESINTAPILIYRNPLGVIKSLQARSSLWRSEFTETDALLLWLVHNLEAEHATRGLSRAFLDYDCLLHDWRGVMQGVLDHSRIVFPKSFGEIASEAETFLSEDMRHHKFSREKLSAVPLLSQWAYKTIESLDELALNPDQQRAFAQLDEVRGELANMLPIMSGVSTLGHSRKLQILEDKVLSLEVQIESLRDNVIEKEQAILAHRAAWQTIKNSVSYKVTAPIRTLERAIRKFNR